MPTTACRTLPARLPLGQSAFRTLRHSGAIYVDKTDLIGELATSRQKFFLTRPRGFGKSLLLSTFASLFRDGLKDFQGLAIEKHWEDKTYDVATLDFSQVKDFQTAESFQQRLEAHLSHQLAPVGFRPTDASRTLLSQFDRWLQTREPSSLVLLIDDCDAPLTACINRPALFAAVLTVLSRFYAIVKGCEGCLRFFFMTGVTKIENTPSFSSFLPADDISLLPRFGSLLGFTEAELAQHFSDWLRPAVKTAGFADVSALMTELRRMYGGFCFDLFGETSVYAPHSVLKFLQDPRAGLRNYWQENDEKPAALIRLLRARRPNTPAAGAAPQIVPVDWLSQPWSLATLKPPVVLAQTGYLTIKKSDGSLMTLGCPNEEARQSMAQLCTEISALAD